MQHPFIRRDISNDEYLKATYNEYLLTFYSFEMFCVKAWHLKYGRKVYQKRSRIHGRCFICL